MKKILAFLLALSFSLVARADIISYTQFTAGTTIGELNDATNKIYIDHNGNITTDNIKDGTLLDSDFANSASPRIRTEENIGNYTYTGMLPATDATLASDISAGTSYVNGYRVVKSATAHTYTATKDTWVYIDQNGAYQFSEVAVGAAEPTTPANSLLLATVTTDGTSITVVTDRRQLTPPGLRVYSTYKNGLVISRDVSTATTVNIASGDIEFGTSVTNGKRSNNAPTNVNLATTGVGGLDVGSLAQGYYYIFAVPTSTNSTNYDGIASLSSTDAAGVTDERLVGWCYANTASAISPDSVGAFRGKGGDAPNIVNNFLSADITLTSPTVAAYLDGVEVKFFTSGRPVFINCNGWGRKAAGTSATLNARINIDGIDLSNSERSIFYYDGQNTPFSISTVAKLGPGEHTLRLKVQVPAGGGNIVIKNRDITIIEQ